MSEVVRFSVSLEEDLLEQFDRLCTDEKYATRSEAIRQLLRERLTTAAVDADAKQVTASLVIVYDHHRPALLQKLLELQHEHPDQVISTMHVHLDHDLCMEVIVMRGRASSLRQFAGNLRGLKGIHQGQLVFAHASVPHDHHGEHGHPHHGHSH
jgi:CopG family nickel-responsive transcriptional regulator